MPSRPPRTQRRPPPAPQAPRNAPEVRPPADEGSPTQPPPRSVPAASVESSARRVSPRLPWGLAAVSVLAAVFFALRKPPGATPLAVTTASASSSGNASVGPWGRLERVPFFLEQPMHYYTPSACLSGASRWVLPGYTPESVRALFTSAGVDGAQAEALTRATRCDPMGCVVMPGADLVMNLAPTSRAALYTQLGRFPMNPGQAFPFSRPASDPRWSALSGMVDLAMVERLSWRRGSEVLFSDLELLCARLTNDAARTRLLETLSRMSAVMAWLVITPDTDLDALVAWWGPSAQSRNLRPMFEAVARRPGGGVLDLIHVLPPFARRRLNTFPHTDDPPRDCYWTALNFFATTQPPDVFVDGNGALATLERSYTRVPFEERRFGDVLLFVVPGRDPVHAVNYIADDLVFSKNGNHFRRPWSLVPMQEIRDTYPDATELRVYRLRAYPSSAEHATGMR